MSKEKPKVVAFIPARRDSERLPGKNKKMFCGKPLIAWTIELALNYNMIDEILISTNDHDIMGYCRNHYVNSDLKKDLIISYRPEELAQANTPMKDVLIHEIPSNGFDVNRDIIVLLQPTSPLRNNKDLAMEIGLFKNTRFPIASVYREDDYTLKFNGAIFVFTINQLITFGGFQEFNHMLVYIMPKERSIDIDTLEDFQEAENYMKAQKLAEKRLQF